MFTRCLFCHHRFAANDALEHMPRANRVAFDPVRGRLWAVCTRCGRWNLVPLAGRWEAVEELERLSRDRARVLARTDNVALLATTGLDVVRVGRAPLREEAWWRYGRELLRAMHRSPAFRRMANALDVALAVATRGAYRDLVRWRRFGNTAWRGESTCPRCGHVLTSLAFWRTWRFTLVPSATGALTLEYGCTRCAEGAHVLTGVEAEHVLRRSLAYHHFGGSDETDLRRAMDAIERIGSPERVVERLAAEEAYVGSLVLANNRPRGLALEISLSQNTEQGWLKMELAALEACWREEEILAAIIDCELTPVEGLERLRAQSAEPAGERVP